MTPPPRTWQRVIHELRDGPLPAAVAIRRAGFERGVRSSRASVLATATYGEPRLCEWEADGEVWLGLTDNAGDVRGDHGTGVDGTGVACSARECYDWRTKSMSERGASRLGRDRTSEVRCD